MPASARGPIPPWPLALGVACFLVLHGFFWLTWSRWFAPAVLDRAWFLGSRPAIVTTQVAIGLVAAILAAAGREGWRQRFRRAGLFAAGVLLAVAAVFFAIGPAELMVGPPRLWPWVLFSAAGLLLPAVLAGTLLGGALGTR